MTQISNTSVGIFLNAFTYIYIYAFSAVRLYIFYQYLSVLFRPVVLNLFFHRENFWSKCKSHGPHACIDDVICKWQTNQIYSIIFSLNIMISKRLHLLK